MMGLETRHFALVVCLMIMCIFSVSVLLPFSFSGGVSLPAREKQQEMQDIRQKNASHEQISQVNNKSWKHIHHIQQIDKTHLQQMHQTHEQQRIHLTEITQKVRKLSQVFNHSYIRTFFMYTHSGLHSVPPRSLSLSVSFTHTHRHRWVKKCMHSKTCSTGLRMALSLR